MHRLRVKFRCGDELKYISHLDLMRCWERALRRAGLPIAYSEGFTPHPRFALAAPLPVGMTGEAEQMDLFFNEWLAPDMFRVQMRNQLPPGLSIVEAIPIGLSAASLQSQVRFAEYIVAVDSEKSAADTNQAIKTILGSIEIPWQHVRDKVVRSYDLRIMIDDIKVIDDNGTSLTIFMRLKCDTSGTGRPEQVMKALGFTGYPHSIIRTGLVFGK
jgi:radical SAM-linked protein